MMDDYVLVVDDNEACRDIGKILFESLLRVEVAKNGVEAVDFISSQIPRMILLDLNMPLMNGHQVLDYLQADPVRASIPVIVWSADFTVRYKGNGAQWPTQVVEVLRKGQTKLSDLRQLCLSQITERVH